MVSIQAKKVRKLPDPFDALVRIGSITDEVAQTPDRLVVSRAGARVLQHGVESGQIGVDIGDHQHVHHGGY
jgi:hypothetical protein